ncbi:MAG: DUF1289 domain-containing protein [Albidovulum sp.]|nr:DUF1289 domain-containing protein [Albidovulum sp.]MDE0303453.1 DUF1289 domain-containing protein [Albidovulum sp.]MDE0532420.1 DUF1289 domain-containing protein [Albidovulum sp.]
MKSENWTRDEPDSPCKRVCVIHPEFGICLGCFRTAKEVGRWAKFSSEKRQRILVDLPSRASILQVRRGGRRRKNRPKEE